MQVIGDVEAVFAALGMAPFTYRVFPPPAAQDGAPAGCAPAEARPMPGQDRRRRRIRPDVGRSDTLGHPARSLHR